MGVGQPREQRLLEHVVVEEQPEIGVVAQGDDVASALGGLHQDVADGVGFGRR